MASSAATAPQINRGVDLKADVGTGASVMSRFKAGQATRMGAVTTHRAACEALGLKHHPIPRASPADSRPPGRLHDHLTIRAIVRLCRDRLRSACGWPTLSARNPEGTCRRPPDIPSTGRRRCGCSEVESPSARRPTHSGSHRRPNSRGSRPRKTKAVA